MSNYSKDHTLIAKGAAILLMLFDHLYWLDFGSYSSVINLLQYRNFPWLIGSIGNICVAMYLFLSGVGMGKKKGKESFKSSIQRIWNFYKKYLVITIIFVMIGCCCGKLEFDFRTFILNLLCVNYEYNIFAWFVITYIVIIFVFPLFQKLIDNTNIAINIISVIGVKVGITFIYYLLRNSIGVSGEVYKVMIEPFMFLPVFLIGYILAKKCFIEKIDMVINKTKIPRLIYALIIALTMVFMIIFPQTIFDNITAPILCICFSYMIKDTKAEKVFQYIGEKSMYIWLIHYYLLIYIGKIIYLPKYWLLILIWFIIIMLPVCKVLDLIFNLIGKRRKVQ